MIGVPQFIVERQLGHFDIADPACGAGVREALAKAGHPVEEPVAGDGFFSGNSKQQRAR
jgi:hypothetical protein